MSIADSIPEVREERASKRTRSFLFWTSIASEPFVVLYALAPFILRKELGASLLQLSILSSLRPLLPVLSFYWSSGLHQNRHSLRRNLILAWFFARAPFLLLPLFPNSWYFICCCAIYELFKKSGTPAFIEILKINIKEGSREKNYCLCFALTFTESVLFGIAIVCLLDSEFFIWWRAFAIAAAISLVSLTIHFNVAKASPQEERSSEDRKIISRLITPWKNVFVLLRENEGFFRFQCGFMMGGAGLMLMAPVLPLIYVDNLCLSSSEVAIGRSVLMGLGVISSVYFWWKMISERRIERLLRNVLLGFALYLILTLCSISFSPIFYLSSLVYGIAQAGSHLLWNLSGPIFSGDEDSTRFSGVNVLMVGVRGAFIPALGGTLGSLFGPIPVIVLAFCFCLAGALYMTNVSKRLPKRA